MVINPTFIKWKLGVDEYHTVSDSNLLMTLILHCCGWLIWWETTFRFCCPHQRNNHIFTTIELSLQIPLFYWGKSPTNQKFKISFRNKIRLSDCTFDFDSISQNQTKIHLLTTGWLSTEIPLFHWGKNPITNQNR